MTSFPQYDDAAPGPHTSVSNRSTETAPVAPALSSASTGQEGNVLDAGEETEKIAPQQPSLPLTEAWTAPSVQLPDIATASYGPTPDLEHVVQGADSRIPVEDTTAYPWRGHASLVITARDNSVWSSTGWFIGPQTLITAGHALYIKGSDVPGRDGWVKSIDVVVGRDGAKAPFGSVRSASFRTTYGWTHEGSEFFDYGCVIIPTKLGETVGWLGYGSLSNADLAGATVNLAGYASDKEPGTQWYDTHRIAGLDTRKIYYDLPTSGGLGGSAVYKVVDGERIVVGIHSHGGASSNSGIRISTPVFKNIRAWNV
jgi:glutamyl endopeptidase